MAVEVESWHFTDGSLDVPEKIGAASMADKTHVVEQFHKVRSDQNFFQLT